MWAGAHDGAEQLEDDHLRGSAAVVNLVLGPGHHAAQDNRRRKLRGVPSRSEREGGFRGVPLLTIYYTVTHGPGVRQALNVVELIRRNVLGRVVGAQKPGQDRQATHRQPPYGRRHDRYQRALRRAQVLIV